MRVASYGTVHSRIERHYTPISTPQRKKTATPLGGRGVRFRRRFQGGSQRALCSFRCRFDSRWLRAHDRALSGQQIEQLGDGDEFVGLFCQFDPPEHKALTRREGRDRVDRGLVLSLGQGFTPWPTVIGNFLATRVCVAKDPRCWRGSKGRVLHPNIVQSERACRGSAAPRTSPRLAG